LGSKGLAENLIEKTSSVISDSNGLSYESQKLLHTFLLRLKTDLKGKRNYEASIQSQPLRSSEEMKAHIQYLINAIAFHRCKNEAEVKRLQKRVEKDPDLPEILRQAIGFFIPKHEPEVTNLLIGAFPEAIVEIISLAYYTVTRKEFLEEQMLRFSKSVNRSFAMKKPPTPQQMAELQGKIETTLHSILNSALQKGIDGKFEMKDPQQQNAYDHFKQTLKAFQDKTATLLKRSDTPYIVEQYEKERGKNIDLAVELDENLTQPMKNVLKEEFSRIHQTFKRILEKKEKGESIKQDLKTFTNTQIKKYIIKTIPLPLYKSVLEPIIKNIAVDHANTTAQGLIKLLGDHAVQKLLMRHLVKPLVSKPS